jgi:hypothetical protein
LLRISPVLSVWFLLLGASLHAASVSGTVKDPSGAVVPGAAAALTPARGATLTTTTDAQGRFRFAEPAPGQYTLQLTNPGFEPWQHTVTVSEKPLDISVSLVVKVVSFSVQVSGKRSPLANSDPNYLALRGGKLTKVYRVKDLALQRDVGKFLFRSGSFSFLPPVLGQPVAGVFVGDGNFQLKPAYELAAKQLRRIAEVDAVDEDFTAMVVYFSDYTFEEIKKQSELADESPQRHEEAFKRVKDTLGKRRVPGMTRASARFTTLERLLNFEDIPNYEAEVLAELYNPAQRGSFRAFMRGKKHDDLRFLLNPSGAMAMLPGPEEIALINFDPLSEHDGIWYLSHFASELKSGRASSNEDMRIVEPEHYKIEALIRNQNFIGKERDILVNCSLRFHALYDGIRMVKFDMIPDLQVARVAWNGKEIPFVQESRKADGSFYLQMPEPLVAGRSYQVAFEYSGKEVLDTDYGALPTRRVWYPTPAGPSSRATYALVFHVPHNMTVVTVGKKVRESRDGSFDVSEWHCDIPISQAVFKHLADVNQKTVTDEVTQMELTTYVNRQTRGILPASKSDILIDAGNSVRVFNAWFGPPAFDKLTVLVSSYVDSLPGLVYTVPVLTAGYTSLASQVTVLTRGRGMGLRPDIRTRLDEAFPRQIALQWWGNTVGSISFHDAWLSSGFADFSASLFDVEVDRSDEFRDHWSKAREAILKANTMGYRANDTGPVWMGVLNNTWRTPGAGALLAGSKGGYILHMLRSLMWDPNTGDETFRGMMRDYAKRFTNKSASTEDFKAAVERHMTPSMDLDGNHRMDWFFSEWVYGTEIPNYRLEYSLIPQSGGKRLLTGKLTQSGVSAEFKMNVPLFAEFDGKIVRIGVMTMRGNSTGDVKVVLPEAPKRITINANRDVLVDKQEVKALK